MNLPYLQTNCILTHGLAYRPRVIPVDYGGFTAYLASVHLMDGTPLTRSSFQVDAALPEEARIDATVLLLQQAAAESGLRPRCDYLDAALTKSYRQLIGLPPIAYLVSACLCGECCRYDGGDNRVPAIIALVEAEAAFPVCPEVSGGLPTPRPPCERCGEQVLACTGADCTAAFAAGATLALAAARTLGVTRAILKARSPSCGADGIYDGSFSHRLIPGQGLTARLLAEEGLSLSTEEALL